MSANDHKYWFPAKRYGWGWGLPITWQGWSVFIVWFAAVLLANFYLIPRNVYAHLTFGVAMVCLLVSICYKKGEPPRWRFGDRD